MQFKNPELLYFLLLLVVPILVHLFQLQKFKKIAFTNVAFLQKISQQTRKSSKLKKWLILTTRLLLFGSLIFAFSQPYFPSENSKKNNTENYVYLDNSLSLNSKGKRGDLLQIFSQNILENLDNNSTVSLLTNDNFYQNSNKNELSNILKNSKYSVKRKDFKELLLEIQSKANTKTKSLDKVFFISDFQNIKENNFTDVNIDFLLIQDTPQAQNNVSIDSLRIKKQTGATVTLQIFITNFGEKQNALPFSIFINKKLNNKQSISIEKNESKSIEFTLQKSPYILGEIQLDYQDTFLFDNRFYFTLDYRSKISVLSIGKKSNFLERIFNNSEFNFKESSTSNVDYNTIPNQQFIILNELDQISSTLKNAIQRFTDNGGTLLIIPSTTINISNYNSFFSKYQRGRIQNSMRDSLLITEIAFNHPVFSDVFSKKVQNFEYPRVIKRYKTSFQGNSILSFANKIAFLEQIPTGNGKLFWFSGALNSKNSNFSRSPLIVPTLYNLAHQNTYIPKPYYFAGNNFKVRVKTKLKKDNVLKVSKSNTVFIPLQQTQFNNVTLSLSDNLNKSGFYAITRNNDTLQHLAINYHPLESTHNYLDVSSLAKENNQIKILSSIEGLFKEIKEKNEDLGLWKLFLALAIVSLCFEILILKFFKA